MTRVPLPARSPLRRRALLGVGLLAAAAVLAVAAWLWFRPRPPAPPLPDLAGVDPEVAELVAQTRGEVMRRPASAETWGRLGMVYRAHDFVAESLACLAEAERLDPREPCWPYLQGLTRVITDPDAGIADLERATERCGDEPLVARLRLAEALLEAGRLDEAQSHLDRALQVQPDSCRARLGLGRRALLRGEWRTGMDRLAACVHDEHARKMALGLRAEAWNRLGEPDRARAEQARAEELPPDLAWADPFRDRVLEWFRGLRERMARAASLDQSGRTDEAGEVLEETAARYPYSVETWVRLGDLRLRQNDPGRAEVAYHKAVQADPDAAEAWFRLGCAQALRGPKEAADSFRRAIRLRPDHTLAHYNLAHRLRELGDLAGAADEFRAALRCQPDYAPARDALKKIESAVGGKGP
jgi:cytochrome c-type biogenesis protein CcmH/NrfG